MCICIDSKFWNLPRRLLASKDTHVTPWNCQELSNLTVGSLQPFLHVVSVSPQYVLCNSHALTLFFHLGNVQCQVVEHGEHGWTCLLRMTFIHSTLIWPVACLSKVMKTFLHWHPSGFNQIDNFLKLSQSCILIWTFGYVDIDKTPWLMVYTFHTQSLEVVINLSGHLYYHASQLTLSCDWSAGLAVIHFTPFFNPTLRSYSATVF